MLSVSTQTDIAFLVLYALFTIWTIFNLVRRVHGTGAAFTWLLLFCLCRLISQSCGIATFSQLDELGYYDDYSRITSVYSTALVTTNIGYAFLIAVSISLYGYAVSYTATKKVPNASRARSTFTASNILHFLNIVALIFVIVGLGYAVHMTEAGVNLTSALTTPGGQCLYTLVTLVLLVLTAHALFRGPQHRYCFANRPDIPPTSKKTTLVAILVAMPLYLINVGFGLWRVFHYEYYAGSFGSLVFMQYVTEVLVVLVFCLIGHILKSLSRREWAAGPDAVRIVDPEVTSSEYGKEHSCSS